MPGAGTTAACCPDAPPEAWGFLGIVFRAAEDDSAFEGFYVRPANGRSCTDPVRRAHGCQYFAYPGYSFLYFRERGITRYEAPTQTDLDEWIDLRAVVEEDTAAFYLNGGSDPVLTVAGLKHGPRTRGSVGIFVDNGTRGWSAALGGLRRLSLNGKDNCILPHIRPARPGHSIVTGGRFFCSPKTSGSAGGSKELKR